MTTENSPGCLLAGDIGGTKTSLALFRPDKAPLLPLAEMTVNNDTGVGLEEIIASFLEKQTARPRSACFGVAGPVINNRVRMTNLPWTVDARALRQRFRMRSVTLINDLVATAMGSVSLPADQLHTLNGGRPDPEGAVAVIAPGTGLGQAFLVRYRGRFLPFPSEGGHCAFAPANEQQARLLAFMARRLDHVSAEQVCSGIGIPSLYDFLQAERPGHTPARSAAEDGDRTRAIVEAALAAGKEGGDRLAADALALFAAILATESANLVLKILATGGLYIGGGLPPRILPFLTTKAFMGNFCRGRHRQLLAGVPVHVILEPRTALIGAAAYAFAFGSGARDRP
ncbi:MAG: glucokinase [Desulfobulbaceae bacterium]|jgi:glucokinase|nr:glucokinase [Desulfobulbaceae bacterium]MDY0349919.1 glucokinase [Desulfobulbaceae bacterium]